MTTKNQMPKIHLENNAAFILRSKNTRSAIYALLLFRKSSATWEKIKR